MGAKRQLSTPNRKVAVLFSGGRDSSLAACLLAHMGRQVHLINCNNGVSIGRDLSEYRVNELKARFPDRAFAQVVLPSYGLFRRLALVDLEKDIKRYETCLVVLGSQLAMHTQAAIYCMEQHISILASGFSGYQTHYPEQMKPAIDLFTRFLAEYGIKYITPISGYQSEEEVKYRLFDFGVSTKSLEDTSVFSDTGTPPTSALVKSYIRDKLPQCRDFIKFMQAQHDIPSRRRSKR